MAADAAGVKSVPALVLNDRVFHINFGASIDDLKSKKVNKMSEVAQQKDRFWLYVGITVFVIVTGILLIKQSENEKFAPIKQQVEEENAQMNIRVLN
jgi:cytochrome b subunit of formate dehydrogenase